MDFTSGDHRNLLDIIDSLRAQGISRYVDLPEIIVCGDQSAGKSSVLEAISGMRFPTKDGLCTRFATELVLRRGPEASTKVCITPGQGRYDKERDDLERWQPRTSIDKDGLESVTEEAMEVMGVPVARRFYDDTLRIELTGPNQPHLTMVDLPGLFRAANKEQSDDDVDTVRSMVEKYMARPRSIILAVVSAKNEYVLQEVTSMAKQADPQGLRTMGLITKPDTLDDGSDSEAYWVRLAQNNEVELRLGWHVLRNRNFEQRGSSSAQRDAKEEEFFANGIWTGVDPLHCGVGSLRTRLSSVLKDQILSQLPSLIRDVESSIHVCTDRLGRLGPVRRTQEEQLRYLLRVGEDFTSLTKQAIDGTYTDRFFGSRKKLEGYATRLRAVVQNRLLDFRDEMLSNGQSQRIIDPDTEAGDEDERSESPRIPRAQYVEEVAHRLKYSRGRELPGLFNPLIVGDLFIDQSQPWRAIAKDLVADIMEAVHNMTELAIEHVAASDVADEVIKFVHESIEALKVELDNKINELLTMATNHPITYNRQLTENVQKAQQARQKSAIKQLIRNTFGSQHFEDADRKINLNPVKFVDLLAQSLEPDMELFGSSAAVDYMEAYYKASPTYPARFLVLTMTLHTQVALNRFIDDVSVLAIENCLVGKVSELFRSDKILNMGPEDISRLAGETTESSVERKRLVEKRKVLNAGLQELVGLKKMRQISGLAESDPEEVKRKPEKTVLNSPKASVTASVTEGSSARSSRNKATPVGDEDFEVYTVPRISPWKEPEPEPEPTRDHEWDFALSTGYGAR
ncbi:hypothetical protein PFICI_13888 [Pestalotiopsis fici W106-1]|uniref:GED domain-containing protein n=1 Tax=Pestalotiopsis fici (strain W106-1 / CGMCC3.15140) TaxID=1229662 RepID=W3WLH2_PESFW|nr:uncharacterized protein PFICI_13888 [Pestalotiopsis fici W106-1]ETS74022.1 hypothetical protein PFICI_13888 [Pestalotiopsis fici W106-1]